MLIEESKGASRGYMALIFLLIGLVMLSDTISRFIFSDKGIIGLGIVSFVLSFAGAVMTLATPRGIQNKSRLIGVFCCLIVGLIAWSIGASFIPTLYLYYKRADVPLFVAIIFAWIPIICEGIRLSVLGAASVLILTLTKTDMSPAHVIVGIAGILSVLCSAGILLRDPVIYAFYYALISSAGLITIGILVGVWRFVTHCSEGEAIL
jgi:hypothetical protein